MVGLTTRFRKAREQILVHLSSDLARKGAIKWNHHPKTHKSPHSHHFTKHKDYNFTMIPRGASYNFTLQQNSHRVNRFNWFPFLDDSVPLHGTFSRHGRTKASFILLIWLNENVGISKAVWSQLHANAFVLSGLDYNFILDMVGFVHLHASMLIEAKTTYSHDW